MYFVVLAVIGGAAVNSQTNLLFWTFGLMISVVIVSTLVSGMMMNGLRCRRLVPDHGAVDEALVVRYELTSTSRFFPAFGLVVAELDAERDGNVRGRPQGFVLHIGPRATLQAEALAWPLRRGTIHFDRIRIVSTFPFGILRRSVTFTQPGRVVVYPKLHRLRRELLQQVRSRDPAGSRTSNEGGGGEEFFGLRDYRPGDTTRLIDWKHSASTGRLVSRDLTRLTPPRLMVLIDLRRAADVPRETTERAISFAASLVCEAHMEGIDCGIAVAGGLFPTFPPHHSRWHRTRILHALGDMDVSHAHENTWALPPTRGVNWAVIHVGDEDRAFGPPGAIHLTGAQLEAWRQHAASPAAVSPQTFAAGAR